MKYKVVGLREELYVGQEVSGHNCDFTYTDAVMKRHVILLSDSVNKVELTLQEDQGECGSGWCTASYGIFDWKEVETFAEKTHTPIENLTIELTKEMLDNCYEDSVETSIFNFSCYGGDEYYPSGGYEVNMEMFRKVAKVKSKRPVHIFYGDSDTCKSHIAALTGKSIFETDSVLSEAMPKYLTEDIIVIGNRWKCTIDAVKDIIFDKDNAEVILVNFNKA